MFQKKRARRGIVLLVVLSLLILFLVIGIAFLVVSQTYRSGAEEFSTAEQAGDDPQALCDSAIIQVLSGTSTPTSAIYGHSLLGDLYGNDGASGTASGGSIVSGSNGQFVQINYTGLASHNTQGNPGYAGYYNGSVFTMLEGPAAGFSARIVGYNPTSASAGSLMVEMFDADSVGLVKQLSNSANYVFANRAFLINGREFNGPGAGYSSATNQLDRAAGSGPIALLPNNVAHPPNSKMLHGLDESWDAPDYQNMFLGSYPSAVKSIPAYHRPSLARYWQAQGGANAKEYILRPEFAGSHSTFNPIDGPWDVDNNGDGIPDSIWLDLGFPAKQAPNGRLMKPIFAIRIEDMDGRLNLNAHGSLINSDAAYTNTVNTGGAAAGGQASVVARRGQGYGPAEILLSRLLGSAEAAKILNLRYGHDGQPGAPGVDDLGVYESLGIPPAFFANNPSLSLYGSPPDLKGRRASYLSHSGHPLTDFQSATNETTDDSYDINLVSPNHHDAAFTAAEMERILRYRDIDSACLPDRLQKAVQNLADNRQLITTHSFDIPAIHTPSAITAFSGMPSASVMDLYIARLKQGGVADANIAAELRKIMPFEFFHGTRMDVNRLWGNGRDENGNHVVDDLGEVANDSIFGQQASYANDYPNGANHHAKQIYARHLYCLLRLLGDYSSLDLLTEAGMNAQEKDEIKARIAAQWAINCVDYRDPDGIMTPFEFDLNPFDGWSVDGDISTDEGGGVVWGCESADAVLSATLAFHDRRVQDTEFDNGPGKTRKDTAEPPAIGDPTLDQVRIPEGSLFLELLATRNRWVSATGNPALPRELYDANGNLMIGAVAAGVSPVWRVVIGPGSSSAQSNGDSNGPEERANTHPDTTSFDPLDMNLLLGKQEPLGGTGANSQPIERVIWFAPIDPTTLPGQLNLPESTTAHYYNRSAGAVIRPGQYAVVGPRRTTAVGSAESDRNLPSTQKIEIDPGGTGVATTDLSGAVNGGITFGADAHTPVGIICASDPPTSWTATTPIGMSLSEPIPKGGDYYDPPTIAVNGLTDHYDNPAAPTNSALDEPLDSRSGMPLEEDDLLETGTELEYKSCYLQRLANPLQAWDPKTNPYITVDWTTIDLTVFNGEDAEPTDWDSNVPEGIGEFDPDDTDPGNAREVRFGTRQRGDNSGTAVNASNSFWNPLTQSPAESNAGGGDAYFNYNLDHTLGYLNKALGPPQSIGGVYKGDPGSPFPWINIPNRPFATHLEIMQVPISSPSRILFEFGRIDMSNPKGTNFLHLLNHGSVGSGDVSNGTYNNGSVYSIFDFLEVPSRFTGTQRWYNPAAFNANGGSAVSTYRAPFNRLSRFRNPGLVNINTIPSGRAGRRIWRAISGLPSTDSDAQWAEIEESREHFDGGFPSPTIVPGVFQSAGSARFAPLPELQRHNVNGTLFREEADHAQGAPHVNSHVPLLINTSANPATNTRRNSSFQFGDITRLGNMITTHSNVYAVWITVGYFEVDSSGKLGEEIGSDTGEINRHRSFYMIDRSIPVAYQPGEAHNVDRCIIHRRFIE